MEQNLIGKLGGRKFLFSLLIAIGMFVLAIIGKIEYDQLMSGLLWTLGIFSVSNAGQKVVGAIK